MTDAKDAVYKIIDIVEVSIMALERVNCDEGNRVLETLKETRKYSNALLDALDSSDTEVDL